MPKQKVNSAAKKRFRRTGTGKLKRAHADRRHILTKKTRKRKRHLRARAYISKVDMNKMDRVLP